MPFSRLHVKNFTVFEDLKLELVDGINVFVGENGTGKTHLLKLMLVAHRVLERRFRHGRGETSHSAGFVGDRLAGVFRVDDDYSLLSRNKKTLASVELSYRKPAATLTLKILPVDGLYVDDPAEKIARHRAIFIPARECVSLANDGFAGLFKRFPLLDETVAEICTDLQVPQAKGGPLPSPFAKAAASVEAATGGRIVFRGGQFHWLGGKRRLRIHQAADGHRRLGEIARLVRNESIVPGGLLLWDEPEANLNPVLLRAAIDLLRALAGGGVQIVLATHSYLLTQALSLLGEFPKPGDPKMRFFGLNRRSATEAVECKSADSVGELADNPILREYAHQYDLDVAAAEQFAKRSHAK
jgi:energy-coupling factor transporter ATP-binding protein EcfA2